MTERQAVIGAIAHWRRMIKWVKIQPRNSKVAAEFMLDAIGEDWGGDCCPLCIFHAHNCQRCIIKPNCKAYGSIHHSINDAVCWRNWLVRANDMLKYLKQLQDQNCWLFNR